MYLLLIIPQINVLFRRRLPGNGDGLGLRQASAGLRGGSPDLRGRSPGLRGGSLATAQRTKHSK
jgi:hypothetical protein